jgi:hypothetical protein
VQRPERQPRRTRAIGGIGELQRLGAIDLGPGIQLAVEPVDARQMGLDKVTAGALATAQQARLVGQRQVGRFDRLLPDKLVIRCRPPRVRLSSSL